MRFVVALVLVAAPATLWSADRNLKDCPPAFGVLAQTFAAQFENIKGVSLLPAFADEPLAMRRTFVDIGAIPRIQGAIKRLAPEQQAKAGFDAYLELRLKNYPAWVKRKIYSDVRDVSVLDSITFGRSAEVTGSQIAVAAPPELRNSVSFYKLLVREVEFAIQEAELTMGLLKKSDRAHGEFGAMRAEWDFKRIFPLETLKRHSDILQSSRVSSEVKSAEVRELSRPAETFEQFRTNRLAGSNEVLSTGQTVEQVAKISESTVNLAKGFSSRHAAAVDRLIALRLLSTDEGRRILTSADSRRVRDVISSEKLSSAEQSKLRELFQLGDDVVAKAEIPKKVESRAIAQSAAPAAQAKASVESLLDNPESLRNGYVIEFPSQNLTPNRMTFTDQVLDDLSTVDRAVIQKFVHAIRTAMAAHRTDSSKVRVLANQKGGTKGRPFEVAIIKHGHARLFGCFKDGLYSVTTYDAHAPESISGFNIKYGDLCK